MLSMNTVRKNLIGFQLVSWSGLCRIQKGSQEHERLPEEVMTSVCSPLVSRAIAGLAYPGDVWVSAERDGRGGAMTAREPPPPRQSSGKEGLAPPAPSRDRASNNTENKTILKCKGGFKDLFFFFQECVSVGVESISVHLEIYSLPVTERHLETWHHQTAETVLPCET